MSKMIVVIFTLLFGIANSQTGMMDGDTCDYSCKTCWYGGEVGDNKYCYYCPSNRIDRSWNFWRPYYYCDCPYNTYDQYGSAYCPPCNYQCIECTADANDCNLCNGNYRNSAPSCSCSSGYYDKGVPNCQKCSFPCQTCVSSSSQCTSCDGSLNRGLVSSQCLCNAGYYEANSVCQLCSYKCATCTSNANNCLTCSPNRLSGPTCACLPYYYEDGSSPSCPRCHYSCSSCSSSTKCDTCNATYQRSLPSVSSYCVCANRYYDPGVEACSACNPTCFQCSGSTSTSCKACNGSAFRSLSSGSCLCITGYYETSSTIQLCSACSYTCLTCSGASTTCKSCENSYNRILTSNTCPCWVGYYDNGSSTCQPCSYKCSTCTSNANNCLTCSPNRISGPTCACIPYYYDDGSSPSCIKCQYSCSSCSSSTKCDTCNATYQRLFTSVSAYCVCPDRYYDPLVQACTACHPTCFRCTGAASTSCTACNGNAYRTLSSGSCVCQTGFYETSTATQLCSACLYSCLTCSGASTTCTLCSSTLNRVLSSGTCPCATKYFQNSTLLCDNCHSSCATCTSKLSCSTCITSQLTVIDSTGLCSCAAGKFWNTNICSTCTYFCLTCVGSASNCTSCLANTKRVFSTGFCNCVAGFYDNSAVICLACHYSCVTCTTGLNTGCSSCNSANKRTLSNGVCGCSTGFYDDGANAACAQCSYKCLTCNSPNSCLTCSSSLFRSLNSTTNYCQCYSNYYESNFVCYACMASCLTCTNGLTCTTCNSALNRFLNTTQYTCDCLAGYYANSSGLCAACNSLCATCNNGVTCLTCKSNLNRTYNTNTLTCDCLTGYILVTASNTCLTCQSTCLTCVTNYTNRCATCDSSKLRSLNATTYQCTCPVGYFDDGVNVACAICSYTCLACNVNTNNCTSCPTGSNRVYSSSAGTCYCAQRFYDNNITFNPSATCLACAYYCSTCIQSVSCTTCNSSNYRSMSSVNSKCFCTIGYYDDGINEKCASCNYKCQSCTNSTVCLSCNSSWNRDTPSSTCPCSIGFYENNVPTCSACQYSCLTCTNVTQCATCQPQYNRISNSTTKLCSCIVGYYDPGSAICQLCSYQCLTCVTSGFKCLTCNSSYYRTYNSTAFTCPCNNGFYDNAAPLCLPCNYTCSTCGNNRSCLTCNITRFRTINSFSGLCVCITGYYDNNLTETCLVCQATCLTCINNTNCTSCDASRNRVLNYTADYSGFSDPFCPCSYKFYSLGINSSCSACHFSCSYCSGAIITNCLYCSPSSQRTLQSTGKCTCNQGYYDTNATQGCPICNIACVSCWDNLTTTCFQCNSTNFMMVGKNTCYVNCPTYYFNNVTTMNCQLCQTHCLICINSTNCTQCQSPMFLYFQNSTCVPSCPLGYYANSTTWSCQLCKSGCANCSTSSNCFKCVNSSYYVDKATTLCELCSKFCLTCFGPEQNNCLDCNYPQYLNPQYMCVNMSCSYGKYLDTLKGCVQCSTLFENSLNCNISEAFLCQKSYQLVNGRCVGCNQVPGYALDAYSECNQICGDGLLIYYQCDDGNNLNGDGCSANCIIQDGWNCNTVSQRSVCKLIDSVQIKLVKVIKFARENKIRLILECSLPLQLNNINLKGFFSQLDPSDYSFNLLPQDQSDLTQAIVDVTYNKDIQDKQLSLTYYTQSRRLLYTDANFNRMLATVTFSSSFKVKAFPPANYINKSTYTYYDTASSIIFYLAIGLVLINLVVVPKKYALQSLTFSWIVPYVYLTFFYSTSYTTEWISTVSSTIKYQAAYFGFSLGQCCLTDAIKNTTSQLINNVGTILIVLVVLWLIFLILSFFNLHIEADILAKVQRMFKYFLLTAHLMFSMQLAYAAFYLISNYNLNNKIDALNITLGMFIVIGMFFSIICLWYITRISKFDGSFEEMSSKAATRHTIDKQQQKQQTEHNDSNIVINLAHVKETSRFEPNQFNNTSSAFGMTTMNNPNGTHSSGFQRNQHRTEQSEDEQMGEQESFFPYDYCYLYNNNNKNAKYFLPMLITKIFAYSLFSANLTQYPFQMVVIHLLITTAFLIFVCSVKPFRSKFTQVRIIVIELLTIIVLTAFAIYQYYAKLYIYVQMIEFCVVLAIMLLLSLALIFSIIQQGIIWKDSIRLCCESCCLYFRLRGESKTFNYKGQQEQNIIKVETVNQSEIGQVDAFYARMLQKQALNRQYKRERMIHDTNLEKSLA